ncbi:MFS transporter [Thermocladium modestius]|uniref:MFS transporter n=1 Tax=Thermocladium modestius TaxID=62609 RepID=UPI00166BA4E7|nr:MFS transporter [Thermocladium modestius]
MRKWLIIVQGLVPMLLVGTYQYSWNIFMKPLANSFGVGLPLIQTAYSLFVLFSTLSQVLGGYVADARGPAIVGATGSALAGIGMMTAGLTKSIYAFYALWSLGSTGVGFVYAVSINLGVKWFGKSRGLATGLINMGFGLGSTFFNPFISPLASRGDYLAPMMIIGGALLIVSTALMASSKYPAADKRGKGSNPLPPGPSFWLIFISFSLASIPLQLYSSSLSVMGVRYDYFTVTAAATVLPLFSGIGRPIMGFISDSWGRRNAILAEISMLAVATPLVLSGLPVLYIAAAGLVGFLGGAMMTLYASLIGDRYGTSSSTFLFGIIYNGKFVAAVLASVLFAFMIIRYGLMDAVLLEAGLTAMSIPFFLAAKPGE